MKIFRHLAAAALLAVAGTAAAQDLAQSFNYVGISYVNNHFGVADKKVLDKDDAFTLNGFSLDYNHGFSLSSSMPMFVEAGARLIFGFNSDKEADDYDEYKQNTSWMSIAVPVNYSYKFRVADDFVIKPYTGINFKFNLLGKQKYTVTELSTGDEDKETYDLFDKKDMGDEPFKRFQMGWQIGVDFQYKPFVLGVEYGLDFIKPQKWMNSQLLSVKLGYCF